MGLTSRKKTPKTRELTQVFANVSIIYSTFINRFFKELLR